jgi:hypothetical protein
MFRLKQLEIRKKCESADQNQNESHEIDPNPSKDRAMHERDDPLF